jgi:biotin transport system substrate-specific component
VFAGVTAGLLPFFGTTAGYLFGFVLAAAIVGAMIGLDDSLLWTIFSMLAGFMVIFACGAFYLNMVFIHDWKITLTQGFLIFSFWDLVKLGAAVAVYRAFIPRFTARNVS